jgi:hypothetical protein
VTFEHRLLVGFEDIKAVVFECNVCKTRTSIPLSEFKRPPLSCPQQHAWEPNGLTIESMPVFRALATLFESLVRKDFQGQTGFKVYLEFTCTKSEQNDL